MAQFQLERLSRDGIRNAAQRHAAILVLLAVVCACAGGLLLFIEISDEVLERESDQFDRAVLQWLRPSDPPRWVLEVVRDVTALGSTVVLVLWIAVTALFLALNKKFRACTFVVAAAGTGILVSSILKAAIGRQRPDVFAHDLYVVTASFPSGHAMMSAVVYLTLGALIAEVLRPPLQRLYVMLTAAFLAFVVGLSRLYLGVHWPTDVLAGWAAGAAWAAGAWGLAHFVFARGANPRAGRK
ncbi:MAG: phosphatase PAP2 family protein [Rhodospirillaceae bacterium]